MQDGEVVRVGGERPVHVNVRIVAATHRDLPAMVEAQTFREDLYYRLSVFPIVIPPLRDRPSDIRAFAEYFAERAANRFGLRPVPVSDDGRPRPRRVPLARQRARDGGGHGPGGADRAGSRRSTSAAALGPGTLTGPGRSAGSCRDAAPATPIEPLDIVMRRHIEAALARRTDASTGRTAPRGCCRINPHTLRARMRKLHIDWRGFRAPRATDG